jgi:hypothetical protein
MATAKRAETLGHLQHMTQPETEVEVIQKFGNAGFRKTDDTLEYVTVSRTGSENFSTKVKINTEFSGN